MGAGLPSRVVERRVDCASVFRGLARSADCDRPASLFVYFWKRKAVADLPAPANHMLKRVRYTPSEEQMTRRGKWNARAENGILNQQLVLQDA